MEQFLHGRPGRPQTSGDSLASPKELFKYLKKTYIAISEQDDMSMIQWIMPSPSTMSVLRGQLVSMNGGKKEDEYYLSLLIQFWNQVYDAYNKDENQRPNIRGFSSSDFNGKHNLSAAVLLLLTMRLRCESCDQLVQWSRKLPDVFPTFSSNTIQSALAMVGLHSVCQAIDIEGLSVGELFHNYFVADSR
jgi:hypothetical protein